MNNNDIDKQKLIKSIAFDIINLSRNSLFIALRFLDVALFQFVLEENEQEAAFASDGQSIYYYPKDVIIKYRAEKTAISRSILHTVLHYVFKHPFIDNLVQRTYWDLATDIAIEKVISDIHLKAVQTKRDKEQKEYLDQLLETLPNITAEKVYRYLIDSQMATDQLARLQKLFFQDDHSRWYLQQTMDEASVESNQEQLAEDQEKNNSEQEDQTQSDKQLSNPPANKNEETRAEEKHQKISLDFQMEQKENWQRISESVKIDLETMSKEWADTSGAFMQNIQEVNRDRYDYASFLKKFAVLGEAMQINDEEFDYIYYTYGMDIYKNIPLIEPLEYKEVKRIKEFIIVIDTSASCSGELVQQFLEKTYSILHMQESYFRKINLHIIQCDAKIQSDDLITTTEEFDSYIANMQIKGLGGTDFRPVFSYVDELINRQEFVNLKGLIYFTDGQGIYPTKKTDYETAFVFLSEEVYLPEVPVWAVKLVLQENDIAKIV